MSTNNVSSEGPNTPHFPSDDLSSSDSTNESKSSQDIVKRSLPPEPESSPSISEKSIKHLSSDDEEKGHLSLESIHTVASEVNVAPKEAASSSPKFSSSDSGIEIRVAAIVAPVLSQEVTTVQGTHRRLGEGHSVLALSSSHGDEEVIWELVKGTIAKGSFKKLRLANSNNQIAAYASIAVKDVPDKGKTAEMIEKET